VVGATTTTLVVSFKPNAGTRVERYSTVTITFATKKELAFYKRPTPNLKGKQWEDLSATNPDLYLHFEVKYRDARDSETPGAVVEQRPANGTRMKLGDRIKVTVANEVYTSPDGSGTGTWDPPNVNWANPCRHTKWC
jgi:beta-lactam-binding protein with PASTA domain